MRWLSSDVPDLEYYGLNRSFYLVNVIIIVAYVRGDDEETKKL